MPLAIQGGSGSSSTARAPINGMPAGAAGTPKRSRSSSAGRKSGARSGSAGGSAGRQKAPGGRGVSPRLGGKGADANKEKEKEEEKEKKAAASSSSKTRASSTAPAATPEDPVAVAAAAAWRAAEEDTEGITSEEGSAPSTPPRGRAELVADVGPAAVDPSTPPPRCPTPLSVDARADLVATLPAGAARASALMLESSHGIQRAVWALRTFNGCGPSAEGYLRRFSAVEVEPAQRQKLAAEEHARWTALMRARPMAVRIGRVTHVMEYDSAQYKTGKAGKAKPTAAPAKSYF